MPRFRLKGRTFLIVDDEPEIRSIVGDTLELYGAKVLQAENGSRALEILRNEKIDAFLSDVRMPGGDGVFLLEESRKLSFPVPPIVLMTGYADISEDEAVRRGAARVINKPFDLRGMIHFLADTVAAP
jgi:DNA-binding NtrC family response regulator